MIIWADAREKNATMATALRKMYCDYRGLTNFKPWELWVILRQIRRHFGRKKDLSILDFGAGASPFGAYLNHIGYQHVTCLDRVHCWRRARGMNTESYNKKYNAHVQYVKTDNISTYAGWHDVIFSASVLEHLEEKDRVETMRALAKNLILGGLIIHVVDYNIPEEGETTSIKQLIDNCGIPISYKPDETPGCKEFKAPPDYTWWYKNKTSRVAFFNEKEDK